MPNATTAKTDEAKQTEVVSEKRAYAAPKLTHLGSVAELTLGSGGSRGDGPLGQTRAR